MKIKEVLTVLPQYLLPHHMLSKWMSYFTHCEITWLKNLIIGQIIKIYGVNMTEAAEENINQFASFNAFFTRSLKTGARAITEQSNGVACPADGAVSQAGKIEADTIFQAKGKSYTATQLLGGDPEHAKAFQDGNYATIYLSPKDYHRLHMPLAGKLTEMIHVPGRLFSVNETTTNSVNGLFARNERVVCLFDTEIGPMALILVGAIFVSSVETVWHGVVTPPTISKPRSWHYFENAPQLAKGEEMGQFNMGSTIIVLFGKDAVNWEAGFTAGTEVRLGELIASF